VYYTTVDAFDVAFPDPNADINLDKNVLSALELRVSITDPAYTAGSNAVMSALFVDPGMLLYHHVDNMSTPLTN